jgi:hypothetical protein
MCINGLGLVDVSMQLSKQARQYTFKIKCMTHLKNSKLKK